MVDRVRDRCLAQKAFAKGRFTCELGTKDLDRDGPTIRAPRLEDRAVSTLTNKTLESPPAREHSSDAPPRLGRSFLDAHCDSFFV
jgi:hypothetical protein